MKVSGIALLALLVSGSLPGVASADLSAPPIIYTKSQNPIWVSAEAAKSASGEINWGVLGEEAHRIYEGVLNSKPPLKLTEPGKSTEYDLDFSGVLPDCVHYGAAFEDHFNPPSDRTLQDVAKNARAILSGEIVGIDQGFYRGEPNSLLEVKVTHRVRASEKLASNDVFYVVFPFARFTMGGVTFCKQDSSFPYRPAIGDRILFFPFYESPDAAGQLLYLGPQQMIFEKRGDGLVLPARFKGNESGYQGISELERSLLENQ